MSFDVITFGSATVDIFTEVQKERSVRLCRGDVCEELMAYPSGSKLLIHEPVFAIGGGGTNTAACLSKLGLNVAYCGSIGHDQEGDRVMSWLDSQNIAFVGERVDATTNVSVILDSHLLHDRTILAYKGASDVLSEDSLRDKDLHATWYYFSSLLGESYNTMLSRMRFARANGIAVAFNPSNYQAQQGLESLREPLQLSNFLVLNRDEAALLVGQGSREELARRLRSEGAEIVLVTDGANGVTLLYHETLYSASPRTDVAVAETTGAGDCFASTFLAGLASHLEPKEALRLAFVNVESLVTKIGSKDGLLGRDEAFSRLHHDDRHIEQQNI